MKYMLLNYVREAGWQDLTEADQKHWIGAYRAYVDAMANAGVLVGHGRLQPTVAATTVRMVEGKAEVLDGPYAETKEQFGGYHMIEVVDLDEAISWAARCPTALHGVVEVRPLVDMPGI